MNFFEKIDDYINGRLSDLEQKAFDQELITNSQLQKEVNVERDLIEGIFAAGLRKEMKTLSAESTSQNKDENSNVRIIGINRYRSLAIAASVAALLGAFFWFNLSSPDIQDFASVYYQDPGLPVVMGETDEIQFNEAMTAYKNDDFTLALKTFQSQCETGNIPKACYYSAQCLLNSGSYKEAIPVFSKLIADDGQWREKSEWYMAYAMFLDDDLDYKSIIESIQKNKNHEFYKEAKELQ